MQQDSGGNLKPPIHTVFKNPIHGFDFMKSKKLPIKNILRPNNEINDKFYNAFFFDFFFVSKKMHVTDPIFDFFAILDDTIYKCNNIRLQTYNFICAFVLYEYEKCKKITKIDLPYVILVMKMVSKRETQTGRKNKPTKLQQKFEDFYNNYFSKSLNEKNIVYDDKLSQILHYEADEIVRNIETNIKEHYIQYIYRLVNIYFDLKKKKLELQKIKNKEEKDEKFEKMWIELKNIKNDLLQNNTNYKSLKKHHKWIKDMKKKIIPKKEFEKNSIFYDLVCKPQDYLWHMIAINKEINLLSTKENELKLFHILPLKTSFIPGHITIDTSCLISIFNKKGNAECFKNINKYKDEIWNKYFKMNLRAFKKKGYEFNYIMKTDGISCSLIFVKKGHKNKKGKSVQSKKEKKENAEKINELNNRYIEDQKNIKEILNNKKIVTIDPNYSDLIYSIDNEGNKFRYTRDQRRLETRTKKYAKIVKKINDKEEIKFKINNKEISATITEIQNELAKYNSKTCDLKKFLEYVKKRNASEIMIREHYKQKIFRKLKMNKYINTQKSESKMVKNFKNKYGEPNETVIMYGDYDGKDNIIKRKEPIVTKNLKRALRREGYEVYLINEYNTSALCHKCEHKTETFKERKSEKPKKKDEMEEVWGLLRCSNLNCKVITKKGAKERSIYNRDYNSCKNMQKIVEYLKKHNERPKKYQKE